jgi:ethanolamine utilization protein EutA
MRRSIIAINDDVKKRKCVFDVIFLLNILQKLEVSKEAHMDQSLLSVGIDIGTSTTQVVFCSLKIENLASAWTVPTVKIVEKKIVYKSDIHLTPLIDASTLDAEKIKRIIMKDYENAHINSKEVSTGAVIITGEAARKENAEQLINMLSGLAGEFVVTTAGPDLEGIIAGKGSGACGYSREHSCTVMNFDIGGGTTNIVVFRNGEVIDSACYDIGGRLIKIDSSNKISYVSKKVQKLVSELKSTLKVGDYVIEDQLQEIVSIMSQTIINIAKGAPNDDLSTLLITDHGLKKNYSPDVVFLSGGVADCMDSNETASFPYGDIGLILGKELYKASKQHGIKLVTATETIRATVIGAGVHLTDISGSTINYDYSVLPLKNVPVIKITGDEELKIGHLRVEAIRKRVQWTLHEGSIPLVALAIKGSRTYGFDQLQDLAMDIVAGLDQILQSDQPLIISVENDMAKALGLSIRRHLSRDKPLICIDSISVDNGDYIDIGKPVADGQVLPIIIKTLLFGY